MTCLSVAGLIVLTAGKENEVSSKTGDHAPTWLRAPSKMDDAVVLSNAWSRSVRTNTQRVPDSSIPTDKSGYPAPFVGTGHNSNRLPGRLSQPLR